MPARISRPYWISLHSGAYARGGGHCRGRFNARDRLIDEIELAFTEESELPHVIEASERDDANPWLRRTQWAVYLR
jgi:hypothetical protein